MDLIPLGETLDFIIHWIHSKVKMPKDILVCWDIGIGVAFASSSCRMFYTHVPLFFLLLISSYFLSNCDRT